MMLPIDETLLAHLRAQGVPVALIGAAALGVHGAPRYSVDIDLLTLAPQVLSKAFWRALTTVPPPELRRGDPDDPLEGVVRFASSPPLDLIVGRGAAMRFAVSSATSEGDLGVSVVTPLGLLLLKLEAGGPQDRYDILSLVQAQRALNGAAWLAELPARAGLLSADARRLLRLMEPELG